MQRTIPLLALCAALLLAGVGDAEAQKMRPRVRPAKKLRKAPVKRKAASAAKMRQGAGRRANPGGKGLAHKVARALGRRRQPSSAHRSTIPVKVSRQVDEAAAVGLRGLGSRATVRRGASGKPHVTSDGHHIVDLVLGRWGRSKLRTRGGRTSLASKISRVPGVIDPGLPRE